VKVEPGLDVIAIAKAEVMLHGTGDIANPEHRGCSI